MNRKDLIDAIAAKPGCPVESKADVGRFLDCLAAVVTENLRTDGSAAAEVTLSGIGKLKTVYRDERTARNPHTGESIIVPGKWAVKFRAEKSLADWINGEEG
jgi:DNA-binding protein HU-beta